MARCENRGTSGERGRPHSPETRLDQRNCAISERREVEPCACCRYSAELGGVAAEREVGRHPVRQSLTAQQSGKAAGNVQTRERELGAWACCRYSAELGGVAAEREVGRRSVRQSLVAVARAIVVAVAITIVAQALIPLALAQQIPFLSELLSRDEAFYRLYSEKKRTGTNLAKLEPLRLKGETAFKKGDLPSVLEMLGEGIAFLEGKAWDDHAKFISSIMLESSATVVEPNQELQVALVRMFNVDEARAFSATPAVTFEVRPEASPDQGASAESSPPLRAVTIASHMLIGQASAVAGRRLRIPDGTYWVTAVLESDGRTIAELRKPLYSISDFSDRIRLLQSTVQSIKASADPAVKAVAGLVTTPEFQIQRLGSFSQRSSDEGINPVTELARIETVLTALGQGRDPFSGERGEVERAYQSADGQLVPYRIFVPKAHDGSRMLPLVIALHGALGDERSYFSGVYDPEIIKGEAERRGYIIATPNARTRVGGYSGPGEEDVLQVIRAVTAAYRVDPSRVYLTGHSMGGFGVWLIASHHPELFAALAPISGGPPVPQDALPALLSKLKNVPVLVVHGAKDGIVAPDQSRLMVTQSQKAGLAVQYIEAPDADHLTVVAPTFPAVLDFFDKQRKSAVAK